MIIEITARNCFAFEDEVIFSLKADMRNKKNGANVHQESNFNVLKTAGIYGPNNSGKTCLIKCIRAIKYALLNQKIDLMPNLFSNDPICQLSIKFLSLGKEYFYSFKYDSKKEEYPYEYFSEIKKDKYNNEKEICLLKRDSENNEYHSSDPDVEKIIQYVSQTNLLIYSIDSSKFELIYKVKEIVQEFANKIDIVNMNNIPIQHTIDLLKNKDRLQQKIVDFIKNADLYLDNYEYITPDKIEIKKANTPEEKALDIPSKLVDQLSLVSTYKGIHVPSIIFDSTGTKKIAALSSYVIESLEKGRILIVDELDSSIHFKLTRAIVSMFNNELNDKAQMIFTVHDINLMDCKRLFRKEQIWFVHKDNQGIYLYSLADFTAQDGVRDTSDIVDKYKKGTLGALPEPELINSLLDISKEKNKE